MSTCLVIVGVLFLGIAAAAFIGAIVFFVMARKRATSAPRSSGVIVTPVAPPAPPPAKSPVAPPAPAPVAVRPPTPQTPAPAVPSTPPPIAPKVEDDSTAPTLFVPLAQMKQFGRITFTKGPLAGKTFDIPSEGLWIGRAEPADIVLNAPSISKKHVWIGVRNDRVTVLDEASTNGTFINRLRIREQQLNAGDEVVLADDVVRFRFEE